MRNVLIPVMALLTVACSDSDAQIEKSVPSGTPLGRATFAGGCFWCVEEAFDKVEGVVSTTSGYAGGHTQSPTYQEVITGRTGHAEVVRVVYDPDKISYGQLLNVFWRNTDPLTANRQFCDEGSQVRSAIFYESAEQHRLAEASKRALERSGRFTEPIVTEVNPVRAFWPAEKYHQNYHQKNPLRYKYYKYSCGRAQRLQQLWGNS